MLAQITTVLRSTGLAALMILHLNPVVKVPASPSGVWIHGDILVHPQADCILGPLFKAVEDIVWRPIYSTRFSFPLSLR